MNFCVIECKKSCVAIITFCNQWNCYVETIYEVCEYPSTNEIIATPIGDAVLGEVFYQTSDMILDDRASGCERFGRELDSFIISYRKGGRLVRRVLFLDVNWVPPLNLGLSLGTRILSYHDDNHIVKAGASTRLNLNVAIRLIQTLNCHTLIFSCLIEFYLMKIQPL